MKGYAVFLGTKDVQNLVLDACYGSKKVALQKAKQFVKPHEYKDIILVKIDSGNKLIQKNSFGNYFEF